MGITDTLCIRVSKYIHIIYKRGGHTGKTKKERGQDARDKASALVQLSVPTASDLVAGHAGSRPACARILRRRGKLKYKIPLLSSTYVVLESVLVWYLRQYLSGS